MLGVGFEPTKLSLVDLKSTPLDHSGIPAKMVLKIEKIGIKIFIPKNAPYWGRTSDLSVNSRTL